MRVERLLDRFLGGHIKVGSVTIFGRNAMHWGVSISRRRDYLCFRLPLRCFGRWWPLYLYASPNATPWAATWIVGDGYAGKERRAQLAGLPQPPPRHGAER